MSLSKTEVDKYINIIDDEGENLSAWERDYIADFIDNDYFVYNEDQIKKIMEIYDARC